MAQAAETNPKFAMNLKKLLRRLVLAQSLQAVTKPSLQRSGGIGVERHQIPEGLAAISAQPTQWRGAGIRSPPRGFAYRPVRMRGKLIQRFCLLPRVFSHAPRA